MSQGFSHFTQQFPDRIVRDVEKYFCTDAALFKPTIFLGEPMVATDFSVVVPSVAPPDTYINGKLKNFQSGKIIAFNPGDTISSVRATPTRQYHSIMIKTELVNKIAGELGCPGDVRFLNLQNPYSIELVQAINSFETETRRPDCFPLMLDCLSVQITAILLRELKTNLKKYPKNSPKGNDYINTAIEYIQTFFSSNITIEDICREINVSPFHFIRSFKKKTGVSPYQYLLNVRIKKAEELLRTGKYSVSETAMLCGFVSLPHFSNTFKRITGHSPSSFSNSPPHK